jgi:ATP-dependent DNA helicase
MGEADKESELEKPVVAEGEGDEDEDTEGMDMKARALTKLLQTSSVSCIDTLYKGFID